jgi:hypothetical protein
LGCRVKLGVFKGGKRSFQKIKTKIIPFIKNPKLESHILNIKKSKLIPSKIFKTKTKILLKLGNWPTMIN